MPLHGDARTLVDPGGRKARSDQAADTEYQGDATDSWRRRPAMKSRPEHRACGHLAQCAAKTVIAAARASANAFSESPIRLVHDLGNSVETMAVGVGISSAPSSEPFGSGL